MENNQTVALRDSVESSPINKSINNLDYSPRDKKMVIVGKPKSLKKFKKRKGGRPTQFERELEDIQEGDYVKVTIEKIERQNKQ